LEHQERYPGLIDLNPSAAEIAELLAAGRFFNNTATPFDPASQDVLTVFSTVVIFDGRTQNISVERVRGLDLSLDTTTDSSYGALTLGLNATYTLKHDRNITATSPTFSLLNEVGKPIRFRARANAGVSRGPFGINAYLNYANSYSNPFSTPASKMPSWTTLDLSLTFSGATLETTPALQGFNATVAIDNVFDKDPPTFLESGNGLRYDSTNASAVGRFLSLRISKNW
jgi:outer membrane receptor protein involved in Fe transport